MFLESDYNFESFDPHRSSCMMTSDSPNNSESSIHRNSCMMTSGSPNNSESSIHRNSCMMPIVAALITVKAVFTGAAV